jgi:hypothetical protein
MRERTTWKTWTRREDNIIIDSQEMGRRDGLDSPGSGYGQVVSSCENSNEPLVSIKFGDIANLGKY